MTTTPAMPELPDGATVLPDGSAFAIASFPLPSDHWLYAPREYRDGEEEPIELPSPILSHQAHGDIVRAAIRYAVRSATMCGKEPDFDPDALVQNAMYALCGPFGGATLQAQPAADWQTPTTYAQRFTEAVALLCREIPPADMVAGWIDRASDDHRLQDWACERAPAWAQGIGLLDAAHVMADQPTEGVDHEPAQPAAVSDGEIVKLAFEMCSACYSGMDHQFAGMSVVKFARAILALRPQAVPMTDEQRQRVFAAAEHRVLAFDNVSWRDAIVDEVEAHHRITAPADGEKQA